MSKSELQLTSLCNGHLWLIRNLIGRVHILILEEGHGPLRRVGNCYASKPWMHVGHLLLLLLISRDEHESMARTP